MVVYQPANARRMLLRPFMMIAIALVTMITAWAPNAWAQKNLEWKFVEGRKTNVVMYQDLDMKVRNEETRISQVTDMLWSVHQVRTDKSADIEQEIQRIRVDVRTPRKSFSIDSTKDQVFQDASAKAFADGMLPLAGAKFVTRTDPYGKVTDVIITKDVGDRINRNVPLGEGALSEIAKKSSLQFPGKPISVGDTWTSDIEIDMQVLGKMNVSTTYQYLGEEKKGNLTLDKIKTTTAVKIGAPDKSAALVLTKQSADGNIWFDNELGAIHHSESSQDLEWKLTVGKESITQAMRTELRMEFSVAK